MATTTPSKKPLAFNQSVLDKVARKTKEINKDATLKSLCQNDEQWKGITVFRLNFKGVLISFITLKDAKAIDKKTAETSRLQALELVEGEIRRVEQRCKLVKTTNEENWGRLRALDKVRFLLGGDGK